MLMFDGVRFMNEEKDNFIRNVIVLFFGSVCALSFFVSVIFLLCFLGKQYSVWSAGMEGKAKLNHASFSRQILIKEAEAKRDAAIALASAEVERAKGVAKANQIIGDSLKNNEEYLRYLWIDHIKTGKEQIIYVPTEANLPILESRRVADKK